MTDSTAARRFISRRIGRVTRRTWPVIQTQNLFWWLWMRRVSTPVSALAAVDRALAAATDRDSPTSHRPFQEGSVSGLGSDEWVNIARHRGGDAIVTWQVYL